MNNVELSEPYRPRLIRFLDLIRRDDWNAKVYGITVDDEYPDGPDLETYHDRRLNEDA